MYFSPSFGDVSKLILVMIINTVLTWSWKSSSIPLLKYCLVPWRIIVLSPSSINTFSVGLWWIAAMKTVSIELIKVNFVSLSNNSMFHELTTSLASRSHKFMHYADTCLIFSKSKQSIMCIKKEYNHLCWKTSFLR